MPINNNSLALWHYFWQIISHDMTLIPSSNHIISESDTKKEQAKNQTIGNMTKIVYFVINNIVVYT